MFGTPSSRRRYLNILISQIDKTYLKNLLDFQKINSQRNSLLKLIREGNSQDNELSETPMACSCCDGCIDYICNWISVFQF